MTMATRTCTDTTDQICAFTAFSEVLKNFLITTEPRSAKRYSMSVVQRGIHNNDRMGFSTTVVHFYVDPGSQSLYFTLINQMMAFRECHESDISYRQYRDSS